MKEHTQLELKNIVKKMINMLPNSTYGYGAELKINYDNGWDLDVDMFKDRIRSLSNIADFKGCGELLPYEKKILKLLKNEFDS
jgi:hypothetical protein